MIRVAALVLAALPAAACSAQSEAPVAAFDRSPAGLEQISLTVWTDAGDRNFIVEVAETPQQQATGLMHRQSLGADRGMLFPYATPQPASFWMKNTLIPLDIIFIRPDGTIARIAANTVPMSLEPIPSLEPVSAVLEIRGGRAAELGIEPGDKVAWKR